jgi:hypothetical protein
MIFRFISKFSLLAILLTYSYAEDIYFSDGVLYPAGVASLPIHTDRAKDLATLKGPLEFIEFEIVNWKYRFPWHGIDSSDNRVTIQPGAQFVFLKHITEGLDVGGWEVLDEKGVRLKISRPPHIPSSDTVLELAACDIKDLTEETVLNRLGRPQQITTHDGFKAFLYAKISSRYEPQSRSIRSNTKGHFDGAQFDAKTTHSLSYFEKTSYTPYKFLILFNKDTLVERIEDLSIESYD